MYLVDSHCHLQPNDIKDHLNEARTHEVYYFLNVGCTIDEIPQLLEIANNYSNIKTSIGLHPNEKVEDEPTVEMLIELGLNDKVVAIGETGLDYYRSEGDLDWQRDRFRNHIRAAKKLQKPIIVHSRQAKFDTMAILAQEKADEVGGVLHCFTEDWEMAQEAMDLNFKISFSGIVTFSKAKEIQRVATQLPLESMLIETDSPYLAPMPHRGKTNQPAYVRHVAEFIAQLRQVDVDVIAQHTSRNFFKLFKLPIPNELN